MLLPFYLMVIYYVAYQIRNRKYPIGHPWRPYFISGLSAKIVGALFISVIYQYYYGGGGDTMQYFRFANIINSSFSDSPTKWVNLLFRIPEWYDGDYYDYISQLEWYMIPSNYTVSAIAAFFMIFTFNTFLPTAVLFAAVSFSGIWAMFRTFSTQYPSITKQLSIAILFIPSTVIWGSGIFKDTLCMFGLGWMMYGIFRILIQRKLKPVLIGVTLGSFYVVSLIKVYILAAFVPAILLWIFLQYSHKIRSTFQRIFVKYTLIGVCVVGYMAFASSFSESLGEYSLENFAATSVRTNSNILSITSDEGSAYNIGELDPTPLGLLKKFPAAVNVSLFRPYIWEAKNPLAMFNALEAMLFLVYTIRLFFTIGPSNIVKAISSDPNIQFFLVFALIFAFSVGLSSGNFGTLSRYRIPCLPPYACVLMLIYYRYNSPDKPFFYLR